MTDAALITGKRYSIGRAALEGSIVACLKAWGESYPDELIGVQNMVRQQRQQAKTGSGDGAVMLHSLIPVTLWKMLQRRIDRRWNDDKWIYKTVISHFKIGMVNPRLGYDRGF